MGRRKERRIAAISASRRVKLDLFAEPSGDIGGSSTQEEIGGGDESKIDAKSPSSPSSSGQQPHNPLLLLEQYSDEELDEGSTDEDHAIAEDASVDVDDQETNTAAKETEDIENDDGDKLHMQLLEQPLVDKDSNSRDSSEKLEEVSIIANDSGDLLGVTNKTEEAAYPAAQIAPNKELGGDLRSGWKKVLHEESNQYYYWNVTSGETSWEVPDVFALDTVATPIEKTVGNSEEKINTTTGTFKNITPLDMEEDDISPRKLNNDFVLNHETIDTAERGKRQDEYDEGSNGDTSADTVENQDDGQSRGISLPGDSLMVNGIKLGTRHFVENDTSTTLSSELVKHCESMLEKLNSMEGLNGYVEGYDLKLKYTLEIETRLEDIKALASHGSSLLPFWLHSEAQLERIAAAINHIIERSCSAFISGFEATLKSHEGVGDDSEIDLSGEKAVFPAVVSHSPECTSEKSNSGTQSGGATDTGHLPSMLYQPRYSVEDVGERSEIDRTDTESKLIPKPDNQSAHDLDMDVDMEVEETSTSTSGVHYNINSEISNLHNTLGNQESAVPGPVFSVPPLGEEWVPPPPPDDEPFPPPPPDDEPFPPPPPDEPPEPSYPPVLQSESVQHFLYPENYSLPYSGSGLEYYGQTHAEASGTVLYMNHDGVQVAVGHLPHYYEAVSNAYGSAPAAPVVPSAYYALQNGTLNPVPFTGVSTVNSSGTPSKPVSDNFGSAIGGSLGSHAEAGSSAVTKPDSNVLRTSHGVIEAHADVHFGAPTTSFVENSVSVSSSDATTSATATASTTSKAQSKASRNKKRTAPVVSTLRANKKVSSLVDKWKAVKEELHEEDEEPENPIEILERKRQREIEEWRAQQIASGEAKDNANFQPLGGDWRERVKRKRAEKMKETVKSSSDIQTDLNKQKKQPDLIGLSKDLPSGWQAYWDESSKQVYYGNLLTSETTWTKPKNR